MEDGCLKTDSEFQTSEPGIYAIGDVTAGKMLAHGGGRGTYVVEKIAGCIIPYGFPWYRTECLWNSGSADAFILSRRLLLLELRWKKRRPIR